MNLGKVMSGYDGLVLFWSDYVSFSDYIGLRQVNSAYFRLG